MALKCVFVAFSKNRPCFLMFTCVSLGEKFVISSSVIIGGDSPNNEYVMVMVNLIVPQY